MWPSQAKNQRWLCLVVRRIATVLRMNRNNIIRLRQVVDGLILRDQLVWHFSQYFLRHA
jgi:hypothetical protein